MESNRIFRIDRSRQESSHAQVLKQLKQHLHMGTLRSGDRLPSVRQLANNLEINPKTAHSIYQYLEYERLVEIRPKSGVFVNGGNLAQEQSRKAHLAVKVRRLVREARALGFEEDELWRLMEGCVTVGRSPGLLGVVECNQEMRELLCRDLTRELRVRAVPIPLTELRERLSGEVPRWNFLLTTEYHMREVRDAVQDRGPEVFGVRLNYTILDRLAESLEAGRVLFLAKDKCFVDELESLLRNVLSRPEFEKFIGIPYEDKLLVRYWMNRVRSIYISPNCPDSFRDWVIRNKSDEVSLMELTHIISSESLKQLRDVLFFAGRPFSRGPISQRAIC